ncbi:hypothetical protein JTB14_017676 [Gonioctena quinquepunctata]|nr:hypothetical protein JTB14_017676 [Gonioctena quinquepunctata]
MPPPTLNETHLETNNSGSENNPQSELNVEKSELGSSKIIPTEDKPGPSRERHTSPPPPLQSRPTSTALITPGISKPLPKADCAKLKKGKKRRRQILLYPKKILEEEQLKTKKKKKGRRISRIFR